MFDYTREMTCARLLLMLLDLCDRTLPTQPSSFPTSSLICTPSSPPRLHSQWGPLLLKIVTFQGLLFSPNLIWLVVTVANYLIFPYDFRRAAELDRGWVLERALINLFIVFSYYTFWHASFYIVGVTTRKFSPETRPSLFNLAHNVWYTGIGTLQWAVWEVLIVHCWATGKLR
jgi:hypothetical protein